jgi:hypothetical protein
VSDTRSSKPRGVVHIESPPLMILDDGMLVARSELRLASGNCTTFTQMTHTKSFLLEMAPS